MSLTRTVGDRDTPFGEPALRDVTARLIARFGPQLPDEVIDSVAAACAAEFATARVREFIALFVERHSGEQLSRMVAEQAQLQ